MAVFFVTTSKTLITVMSRLAKIRFPFVPRLQSAKVKENQFVPTINFNLILDKTDRFLITLI